MSHCNIHGQWIEIPKENLLPSALRTKNTSSYFYVFNPSLCEYRGQLYMVYRIAGMDDMRKIAICTITHSYDVVPGSVVFLSETIDDEGYQADPRLFTLNDRLYVIYNNDKCRPQFMCMVEIDPVTLHAKGAVRQLALLGLERKKIEKNWMPFEFHNEMYIVYSVNPLIILRADLSSEKGDIPCTKSDIHEWNVSMPRNAHCACPPFAMGNAYVSFMNVVRFVPTFNSAAWKHFPFGIVNLFRRKKYSVGIYTFQKEKPFLPLNRVSCSFFPKMYKKTPNVPHDIRTPGHSLYISGAMMRPETGEIIVSCGVNNDWCMLYVARINLQELLMNDDLLK